MPQDSQFPRKDETQCWTSPHDLTTFAWPTFFWVSYFSSKCVIRFYFVYKLDAKLAPNSYHTFPSSPITKNFFRGFKGMKLYNLFLCFFFWYVLNCPLYFTSTTPEEYLETSQTSGFFLQKSFIIDVWLCCRYGSVLSVYSFLQNKNEMISCLRNTPS